MNPRDCLRVTCKSLFSINTAWVPSSCSINLEVGQEALGKLTSKFLSLGVCSWPPEPGRMPSEEQDQQACRPWIGLWDLGVCWLQAGSKYFLLWTQTSFFCICICVSMFVCICVHMRMCV